MPNIDPNFSMNSSKKLNYFFSFYFSIIIITFRCFLFFLQSFLRFPVSFNFTFIRKSISDCFQAPILISFIDTMLSLYFHLCDLSPCTLELDDQTTMHFWTPNNRKFNKPDLVIIHGYGGNSRWQFVHQVRALSDRFNLYVPDLLYFGKSYSSRAERTDVFQAKCVAEGMRRLGVDRFTVFGISYGGFVAYQTARMNPEAVEKVVIVNSGISWSEKQKEWHLKRVGRRISGFLVPESPQDLRFLVCLSLCNSDFIRWAPDFMLRQFIEVMHTTHRREQMEMVEYLLNKDTNPDIASLTQESLIIWGDQDKIFPLDFAHQLHRNLGPKSRLEIIKNTGHAANVEAPDQLNTLIKSFVLGQTQITP